MMSLAMGYEGLTMSGNQLADIEREAGVIGRFGRMVG